MDKTQRLLLGYIKELEQREHDAIDALRPAQEPPSDVKGQLEFMREAFLIKPDGTFTDGHPWANCPQKIPVADMLDHQLPLIVDIFPDKAVSEDDFFQTYGMTPTDLARNAKRGLVYLNFYEYNSDREGGYTKHLRSAKLLLPLFEHLAQDTPSGSLQIPCRINSLRREAAFKRLGFNLDEAARQCHHIFAWSLRRCENLEDVVGTSDPDAALQQISERWGYLDVLARGSPKAESWMKRIQETPPLPTQLKDVLTELSVFKNVFASRFTSTFGGFVNLSAKDADRALSFFGTVQPINDVSQIDDPVLREALDELVNLRSLPQETQRVLTDPTLVVEARAALLPLYGKLKTAANRLTAAFHADRLPLEQLHAYIHVRDELISEAQALGIRRPVSAQLVSDQPLIGFKGSGHTDVLTAGMGGATIGRITPAGADTFRESLTVGGVARIATVIDLGEFRARRQAKQRT